MTIQECYEMLCGDYEDAKRRLMSDRLIEKFMLKFPQDGTMKALREALDTGDYQAAFESAHTLKGVAGNLGFTSLQESSSALTEFLRKDRINPEETLVQRICEDYDRVIQTLAIYQEKGGDFRG